MQQRVSADMIFESLLLAMKGFKELNYEDHDQTASKMNSLIKN